MDLQCDDTFLHIVDLHREHVIDVVPEHMAAGDNAIGIPLRQFHIRHFKFSGFFGLCIEIHPLATLACDDSTLASNSIGISKRIIYMLDNQMPHGGR
jgi:hypothetical protein